MMHACLSLQVAVHCNFEMCNVHSFGGGSLLRAYTHVFTCSRLCACARAHTHTQNMPRCLLSVGTAYLCRSEYPKPVAMLLWIMAEVAIIGSDVQEVIGSAIALSLLTQGALPLWQGALISAATSVVLLLVERGGIYGGRWGCVPVVFA